MAEFRQRFEYVLYVPRAGELALDGQGGEVWAVRFREDSVLRREGGGGMDAAGVGVGNWSAEGKIKP